MRIRTGAGSGVVAAVVAAGLVLSQVSEPATAQTRRPCGDAGGQIAFVSDRDGDGEIFVMNVDGSRVRQVTHNEVFDSGPAWSPDGRWIAFDRVAGVKDPTDEGAPHDVFVVRADGTGERNLTNTPEVHEGAPTWSPDGTRVAFHSKRDGDFEIYSVGIDGTGLTNLTNNHPETPDATGRVAADLKPSWSRDGLISFESYRDGIGVNSDIWVMDGTGKNQRSVVATPTSWEWYPTWSPDARRIAYMGAQDGEPFDIYVADVTSGEATNVSASQKTESHPAWSPDGSRLAFASNLYDGGMDVKVYALEWYVPGASPLARDNFDIYTVKVDGTGLTRLTTDVASDTDPSYQPRRRCG